MAEDDDSLFITLYTDADVHGELAKQVRGRGFKARSAYEEKVSAPNRWGVLWPDGDSQG